MVNVTEPDPTSPDWLYLVWSITRFEVVLPDKTFCHMILPTATFDVTEAVRTASDPYTTLLDDDDRVTVMVPVKVI